MIMIHIVCKFLTQLGRVLAFFMLAHRMGVYANSTTQLPEIDCSFSATRTPQWLLITTWRPVAHPDPLSLMLPLVYHRSLCDVHAQPPLSAGPRSGPPRSGPGPHALLDDTAHTRRKTSMTYVPACTVGRPSRPAACMIVIAKPSHIKGRSAIPMNFIIFPGLVFAYRRTIYVQELN